MEPQIKNLAGCKGFTLIELLVAVVIFAILLTAGIPSMTEFVTANRVTTQADKFTRDLNFARSEAVKSGVTVFVCRSANQTACGNGTNWEQGWIVFSDNDGDATLDAGEEVRTSDGLSAGYTLRPGTAAFANQLSYAPSGVSSAADGFSLCRPDGDTAKTRLVTVNAIGQIQLSVPGVGVCP